MKAVAVFPGTKTVKIAAVRTLIAGRYPPEQAFELILGRPTGIKSVIAFDEARVS
jgi:hypothetical protein